MSNKTSPASAAAPQPLRPSDHAAMLKAAPPKDRHVMLAQAANQQRYAARDQRGMPAPPSAASVSSASPFDAADKNDGGGGADGGGGDPRTINLNTIGTRRRAAGQGPTYEERVLASKILKICAAR